MLRFGIQFRQPEQPKRRPRPALIGIGLGLSLALGGCSADFLRFDSPAFNLNGDTSAPDQRAEAPRAAPLYEQSPAADAPYAGRDYGAAPVAGVSRGAPPVAPAAKERTAPPRFARAEPIVETPERSSGSSGTRSGYEPVTTGALPSQGGVIVEPGDTLYQISRRYGVTVSALRQANGLTSNTIRPGQRLALPGGGGDRYGGDDRYDTRPEAAPAPRYREPERRRAAAPEGDSYVVRRGDSLYAISRRTGVSVAELKRLNGITNVRALRPGMRLTLGGDSWQAPPSPRGTRVASRTSPRTRPQIKAKSIRTMPITREKAPPVGDAYQPRILNQRPETPIATKPPAPSTRAPAADVRQTFRWPARGRVIASFNHSGRGVKNDGINIALPLGTNIEAAAGGVVAYAGSELKGYGNLVLVRHDNGWVSAYAHASEILVKRGDRITRGQVIAKAGRSGGVTQPQLHFELRKGAKPVDPLPHLAAL